MTVPELNPLPGIRPTDRWNQQNNPGLRVSNRCKVCKAGGDLLKLVNQLLISGMNYSEVHRTIQPICEARGISISYDSVRNHQQTHLPIESVAIQQIVTRRAEELQQDFANGTQTLVDAVGYAESMMTKGFYSLIDEGTEVSPMEGLAAAQFHAKLLKDKETEASVTSLLHQLDIIISAVKEVVPEEMWAQISQRVQQRTTGGLSVQRAAIAAITVDVDDTDPYDDDEAVYDPTLNNKDRDDDD